MLYRVHLAWVGFDVTMQVMIGIDSIGSKIPTATSSRPRQPLEAQNDILFDFFSNFEMKNILTFNVSYPLESHFSLCITHAMPMKTKDYY